MADKASVKFALTVFGMNLSIVPDFRNLKQMTNDLIRKLSTGSVAETLDVASLERGLKNETGANLDELKVSFGAWSTKALGLLDSIPEDQFEGKRGRDLSKVTVTLFDKTATVPEFAVALIKGSKLEDLLKQGPGQGFVAWSELNQVINMVKTTIDKIVPEDNKPKRTRKSKEAPSEITPNA